MGAAIGGWAVDLADLRHIKAAEFVVGCGCCSASVKERIRIVINHCTMSTLMKSTVATLGLDQWPSQVWAEIASLMPARDDEDRAVLLRLLEIGFLPGEPVRVIARGLPGGDPMAVRVGHTTFALRRHEAAMIQVQAAADRAEAAR
jgi:ferrous iron transport protein A